MCSPKLKSVIIGSNGQQLAILGLSKLVVLLIKRVFHLSFKKTTIIDYLIYKYYLVHLNLDFGCEQKFINPIFH